MGDVSGRPARLGCLAGHGFQARRRRQPQFRRVSLARCRGGVERRRRGAGDQGPRRCRRAARTAEWCHALGDRGSGDGAFGDRAVHRTGLGLCRKCTRAGRDRWHGPDRGRGGGDPRITEGQIEAARRAQPLPYTAARGRVRRTRGHDPQPSDRNAADHDLQQYDDGIADPVGGHPRQPDSPDDRDGPLGVGRREALRGGGAHVRGSWPLGRAHRPHAANSGGPRGRNLPAVRPARSLAAGASREAGGATGGCRSTRRRSVAGEGRNAIAAAAAGTDRVVRCDHASARTQPLGRGGPPWRHEAGRDGGARGGWTQQQRSRAS